MKFLSSNNFPRAGRREMKNKLITNLLSLISEIQQDAFNREGRQCIYTVEERERINALNAEIERIKKNYL